MNKLFFKGLLLLVGALTLISCKKEPVALEITAFNFTDPVVATGIIDQANKTVTINVPFGTDLSNVVGTLTLAAEAAEATVSPDITSGVDFSSESVVFTVTLEDESDSYTVNVLVGENPLRLATIGEEASLDAIANPEIQVAYQWAEDTYGNVADYVSFSDLTEDFISTAEIVWVHYHVTWDPDNGQYTLPSGFETNAKTILTDFVKAGGNLLLTMHAVPMITEIGRVASDFGPTAIDGNPEVIENPDNWGISFLDDVGFGTGFYPADNGDHYLFTDLTTSNVTFEGVTYPAIFLSAPGMKKNDAVLWDFNRLVDLGVLSTQFGCDDPNAAKAAYESATNSVVRASFEWDPAACGVELGTIIEFLPGGEYQGTVVCIGPGAYEWNREDGVANRLGNMEGITQNVLDNFIP